MSHNLETTEVIDDPISNEDIVNQDTSEEDVEMMTNKKSPSEIVKEKGLEQVSDDTAILKLINQVISENDDKVKDYLGGKDKLFGFFVGQVMKLSQGKANPGLVNKFLKENLK